MTAPVELTGAARARRALRVVVSLVLLAGLGSLVVPNASATMVWTEPRRLDPRGEEVTIAANGAGDSIAVWTGDEDFGAVPLAALRQGRGPWGPAQSVWPCTPDLGCGADLGTSQTAIIDGTGRATVAWLALAPGLSAWGYPLYAAQHDPRTGWSTPQVLSRTARQLPSLTADAAGTVTAVWEELESAVGTYPPVEGVRTASKPASGAWSSADLIAEGLNPSATQAPDGTLTVVYTREYTDPGGVEVVATSRTPGGSWREVQSLSAIIPFTHLLGTTVSIDIVPDTVSDADGNVTAAWTICAQEFWPAACEVQSVRKQATGSWTEAENVDHGDFFEIRPTAPRLAVDGEGAVTAVWGLAPSPWSPGAAVRAARRAANGGGWEQPATVAFTPVVAIPDVAADPSGDVVTTWTTLSGPEETVQAAYRPAGGAWQPPTTVDLQAYDDAIWSGHASDVVATGEDAFTTVLSRDHGVFFSDRVDDRTAPTVRVTEPDQTTLTRKVRVAWAAADTQAGVAGVAVRRKAARYDGGFSDWTTWKKNTTAKAATFTGRPGRSYCFAAKATDRAGNTSRWSEARCTTTPVDDRTARATGSWRRVKDAKSYRGTETVTSLRGQRLTLPKASGRAVRLVATTCPRCGVVRVQLGTRDLGTLSLRSAKLRHEGVLPVASFKRVRTGRLVVRVVSSGKPVRIDGIAVRR